MNTTSAIDNFFYCHKCNATSEFTLIGVAEKYTKRTKVTKSESETVETVVPIVNGENQEGHLSEKIIDEDKFKKEFIILYERIIEVFQCPECKEVAVRILWIETDERLTMPSISSIITYPDRQVWHQKPKTEFKKYLPNLIYNIYEELIIAFNSSMKVASGTLARTLIEIICEDRGVTDKLLSKKIDGLDVAPIFKKALHNIRDLGNSSVHRAYHGDINELLLAITAIEHLIHEIYHSAWNEKSLVNTSKQLDMYKSKRR